MDNFKNTAIKTIAEQVSKELGCSLIEAVSKMQGTCVKNGNEEMLEDLISFKNELIDADFG
ncbi:hypothetical protein VPHK453_0093 [Vibrio phage K453]